MKNYPCLCRLKRERVRLGAGFEPLLVLLWLYFRTVPADPANRLSDHGYLLTQSDVANVARLIYGLHNTDDSDVSKLIQNLTHFTNTF